MHKTIITLIALVIILSLNTIYYKNFSFIGQAQSAAQNSCSNVCRPKLKIMSMGDSITEGAGDYLNNGNFYIGYRPMLWKKLTNAGYPLDMVGTKTNFYQNAVFSNPEYANFDRDHEATSGITIEALQTQITNNSVVSTLKPDVISLMIGTNNLYQNNQNVPEIVSKWEQLIRFIYSQSSSSRILVLKLPPIGTTTAIGENTQNYNTSIKSKINDLANEGIKIDWAENNVTLADLPDLIHPNETGDIKIADSIFNYITTNPNYNISNSNYCQLYQSPVVPTAISKPDLVWRNKVTGENVLWYMNNQIMKSGIHMPGVASQDWDIKGVGDFDKE